MTPHRRTLLLALTFILLASSTAYSSQPNIVFVFTDDLGWGDLGVFYQNESKHDKRHRTPHLDRLAAGGLQMRAHYCPAPVCAPSRSSLLTGVHQGNAAVRNNQFDKELEANHTLGSVLREAGYRTCMIGKYGLQDASPRHAILYRRLAERPDNKAKLCKGFGRGRAESPIAETAVKKVDVGTAVQHVVAVTSEQYAPWAR